MTFQAIPFSPSSLNNVIHRVFIPQTSLPRSPAATLNLADVIHCGSLGLHLENKNQDPVIQAIKMWEQDPQ